MRGNVRLRAFTRVLPGVALLSSQVAAQSTIKNPGQHPRYAVELEPHLNVGFFDPPGLDANNGFGPGLRLSFPVAPDGFLSRVNDSVAIGVGVDWVFYDAPESVRARCARFVDAPNDTRVCVELGDEAGHFDYFFVPVVMQWNFWLHKRASVFGEPGVALYYHELTNGEADLAGTLMLQLGGRWHFTDAMALTGRVGFPISSIGLSFLF